MNEKSTLEKLKELRKLYDELYKLKEMINEIYKINIVIIFINNFSDSVYFAFINIMLFKSDDNLFLEFNFMSVMVKLAIVIMLVKNALLCSFCDSTFEKWKKIGIIINQVYVKTDDANVKQEVGLKYLLKWLKN